MGLACVLAAGPAKAPISLNATTMIRFGFPRRSFRSPVIPSRPYRWIVALLVLIGKKSLVAEGSPDSLLERWLQGRLMEKAEILNHTRLASEAFPDIDRLLYGDDDYYTGDDYTKNGDDDYSSTISSSSDKLLYTSPVDISNFALKYTGCQNVHSWSDDYNDNNDSPLIVQRFVTLRLCPARKCSNYNNVGCQQKNAIDFTLRMEDYLQLLTDYQIRKLQLYCSICTACSEFTVPTPSPTPAPTVTDDGYLANSNYYDGNNRQRRTNDGYYYGYNKYRDDDDYYSSAPWYIAEDGKTCKYSKVCENSKSVCSQSATTIPPPTCSYSSDSRYIGPHCSADGTTIRMGVFEDAACSEYVKPYGDIQYSNTQCQDCNAARSYSLVEDDSATQPTNPICGAAFDRAAMCNAGNVSVPLVTQQTGYYAYTDSSVEYYEQANEGAVCSFIDALLEKNFDESGEIYVQTDFDYRNWKKGSEYIKLVHKAGIGQLVGLFLSATVCAAIASYAVYLHKKLWYSKPWVPPRSVLQGNPTCEDDEMSIRSEAGRLSRIQSGIVSVRSSSSDRSYQSPASSMA